jgi:hypothetical protein
LLDSSPLYYRKIESPTITDLEISKLVSKQHSSNIDQLTFNHFTFLKQNNEIQSNRIDDSIKQKYNKICKWISEIIMDEHSPNPTLPLNLKKKSFSQPIKYLPGGINDSLTTLKLKTPKEYKPNISSTYLPTFVHTINFKQVY